MAQEFKDTRYNSAWDKSTWSIIAIVAICCIVPCFGDDGILPIIVCLLMLAFVILTFLSVYYKINGDNLVVYTFFTPKAYPINKIASISRTKSVLSAPATSLTQRIAITFTDKNILKSTDPLIISPVRQSEFISQLVSINPNIKR